MPILFGCGSIVHLGPWIKALYIFDHGSKQLAIRMKKANMHFIFGF